MTLKKYSMNTEKYQVCGNKNTLHNNVYSPLRLTREKRTGEAITIRNSL